MSKGKASHREAVTDARRLQNNAQRWQITLACGHATVVTSKVKPLHAFCRACSSNAATPSYEP